MLDMKSTFNMFRCYQSYQLVRIGFVKLANEDPASRMILHFSDSLLLAHAKLKKK